MATAIDDSLLRHFHALEARLENEPDGVSGEIAVGVYMMSPRPWPKHGGVFGAEPVPVADILA